MQNPTSTDDTSPIVQVIASIIQFGIVGFVGSVPLGLVAALVGGPIVGREIWFLGAVLMGSYFPLRTLMARMTNQESVMNYIPGSLNLNILVIAALGFLLMTPLLWIMTFSALVVGIVIYTFLIQNIFIALGAAMALQLYNIHRQNQNTQTMTTMFNVNFQDMSQRFGMETLVLDDDDVYVMDDDDEDREDTYMEPGVIYHLPEGEDRPVIMSDDVEDVIIVDEADDVQDVIIIDSDTDDDAEKQDAQ